MHKNKRQKLKVLHIIDSFLNRSEVFIYNYLTAFIAFEPYVLAKSSRNELEFPFDNVAVIPVPSSRLTFLWLKSKLFALVTRMDLRESRIENYIKKIKPDLIHAHFGPLGYEMLTVKKKYNIPLVTTFYGYDMSQLPKTEIWRQRYFQLFQEGDLFLVEGSFMRKKLIEMGAPSNRVKIQRIAIHLDKYPKWQPIWNEPTILFIGRFAEKKGLIYALEAVRELRKEIHNLCFRIIGDGPDREYIRQYVKDNHMSECVAFLGMKSHSEVIRELAKASVFIHPSVTATNGDSEGGAPTILLEAQAVGIPIVTTFHADIPNVVEAGNGVYFCQERSVNCLIDSLRVSLKRTIGVDTSFVHKYHDIKNEVKLLEDKYFELLK
jgi:colanic acid/amylovoran/stewartan biosynthesis glycosyltransferase WcaL/AmsK/CpsK